MTNTKKTLIFLIFLFIALTISVQTVFSDENNYQDGWFVVKGDLHCHSYFSGDSNAPMERVIEYSVENGYDFIALTEHNTLRHFREDHSTEDLLIISGYELTLRTVHFNLFGLRSFKQATYLTTRENITEYLEYIRDLGGYISVNHPNDPNYPTEIGYDVPLDFIEVWNRNFKNDDKETLKDWHNLLVEGRKIYAIGGSDEHNYEQIDRKPFNNVFVKEKTEEAILKSLKEGHSYISLSASGPKIQFTCEEAIMGDTVKYSPDKYLNIKIEKVAPTSIVKIYSDQGIEFEEKLDDLQDKNYVFTKKWQMKNRKFYRVEIWTTPNQLAGLSNPIFIEN